MRRSTGLLAAGLVLAVAGSAAGQPFYVRSIAGATTSGNILNGQSFSQDTGPQQVTSNGTGPFDAFSQDPSPNNYYTFHATSNVMTEIGAVHASVTAAARSTGPAGGANASAQGQWNDTITVTSDTLPQGTLVTFRATVVLHRTISGSAGPGVHASANITGPFGLNFQDSLASPNPAESASTVVTTTVGSTLSATSTLTLSADAGGIAPFDLSASVLAENTAFFEFAPITPGASYSTASGTVFPVPEPGSFGLAGVGLIALTIRRYRRRAAA